LRDKRNAAAAKLAKFALRQSEEVLIDEIRVALRPALTPGKQTEERENERALA